MPFKQNIPAPPENGGILGGIASGMISSADYAIKQRDDLAAEERKNQEWGRRQKVIEAFKIKQEDRAAERAEGVATTKHERALEQDTHRSTLRQAEENAKLIETVGEDGRPVYTPTGEAAGMEAYQTPQTRSGDEFLLGYFGNDPDAVAQYKQNLRAKPDGEMISTIMKNEIIPYYQSQVDAFKLKELPPLDQLEREAAATWNSRKGGSNKPASAGMSGPPADAQQSPSTGLFYDPRGIVWSADGVQMGTYPVK